MYLCNQAETEPASKTVELERAKPQDSNPYQDKIYTPIAFAGKYFPMKDTSHVTQKIDNDFFSTFGEFFIALA